MRTIYFLAFALLSLAIAPSWATASGSVLPCSHSQCVRGGIPSTAATSACVSPRRARSDLRVCENDIFPQLRRTAYIGTISHQRGAQLSHSFAAWTTYFILSQAFHLRAKFFVICCGDWSIAAGPFFESRCQDGIFHLPVVDHSYDVGIFKNFSCCLHIFSFSSSEDSFPSMSISSQNLLKTSTTIFTDSANYFRA